jgi:mannose-6-phosphate isomerase
MLPLYPLSFEPILLHRIWGGDRLGAFLNCAVPPGGPFGEAWVLSDRDDHPSRVANGPLAGMTLPELMEMDSRRIVGKPGRFPLLLKFIDAKDVLSVQVHPDDRHSDLLPPGERGKNEAWYVVRAEPESKIYAGLKSGCDAAQLKRALAEKRVAELLASFLAQPGDCVYLQTGTVHAIGGGLLLFEVQQNSDVTFRLYDWDRLDAKTGQPRQLHVEQSLACTDFSCGPTPRCPPIPQGDGREQLVACKHFRMWRLQTERGCQLGSAGECRIVVGIAGTAQLASHSKNYSVEPGRVYLLPAELGAVTCQPAGPITLLEVAVGG